MIISVNGKKRNHGIKDIADFEINGYHGRQCSLDVEYGYEAPASRDFVISTETQIALNGNYDLTIRLPGREVIGLFGMLVDGMSIGEIIDFLQREGIAA